MRASDQRAVHARDHDVDVAAVEDRAVGEVDHVDVGAEELDVVGRHDEVVLEGDFEGDGGAAGDAVEGRRVHAHHAAGRHDADRTDGGDEAGGVDGVGGIVARLGGDVLAG